MDPSSSIIVYSTPDCAYCYTVKDYISSQGFEFEEVDIYMSEEGREKMEQISEQQNVPVTVIGETVIAGWNKKKLREALNTLGSKT